MKKLIRMIKFAHAAEIAAYYAYDGHSKSLSGTENGIELLNIQIDELRHVCDLEKILAIHGYRSNKFLDKIGEKVGKTVGYLCHHTGWLLPILVANKMEKIGTASYEKMSAHAGELGLTNMAFKFSEMAKMEKEHDKFFEELRLEKAKS